MSTQELIPTPRMAEVSPEYAEIMMLGNVLHHSGYFKDVRDQAQAVTKILFGRELGFSPIISISGIHIIEGKPALSSNLMATLIKRSGKYDYRVKVWTHTECVLTFREKAEGKWEDVGKSSFTIEDAKTAGVAGRGSWGKYPKAMLFARALSQGLRTYCPDVSAAPIYNPEEMGVEVNEDGEPKNVAPKPEPKAPLSFKKSASVAPGEYVRPEIKQESALVEIKPQDAPTQEGASGSAETVSTVEGDDMIPPPIMELPPVANDTIDKGMAANFHRAFRSALDPTKRKLADELLKDWLRQQGLINVLGEASTLAIKRECFDDVKMAAIEYAKTV